MSYQTSIHFDPTALLIIKNEVDNSIIQVEAAVSSLAEDQTLPFGIDDALIQLEQCSRVLSLIDIPQLAKIAQYSSELMRKIMKNPKQIQTQEIFTLSESTSMLKRYIEFICLREVKIPLFLLDTLNHLEIALNKPITPIGQYIKPLLDYITPDFNLPQTTVFSEKSKYVHQLYKYSLNKLLTQKENQLDLQAIKLVGIYMLGLAINQPSKQYWELVNYAFSQIENLIINKPRLRTFIGIESNIRHFFESPDRFKANLNDLSDILSICISQENDTSSHIRQQLNISDNLLSDTQLKILSQQFFSPDYETIHTISTLITSEISQIHTDIEYNYQNMTPEKTQEIQAKIYDLANIFKVLNLDETYHHLVEQAHALKQEKKLREGAFAQQLMNTILSAINAIGILEREQTSNRLQLRVNNSNISLDRLDEAHDALLNETKLSVDPIHQVLIQHVDHQNVKILENLPAKLREIAGAMLFLNIETSQKALKIVADFIDQQIIQQAVMNSDQVDAILNTLASVDMLIDNLKYKQPVLHTMFDVALESSEKLKFVA